MFVVSPPSLHIFYSEEHTEQKTNRQMTAKKWARVARATIAGLNYKQGLVFMDYVVANKSQAQIAEEMGVTKSYISLLYTQANRHIQDRLGAKGRMAKMSTKVVKTEFKPSIVRAA